MAAYKTDFSPGKLELNIIQGKSILKEGIFGPKPDPLVVLYLMGSSGFNQGIARYSLSHVARQHRNFDSRGD